MRTAIIVCTLTAGLLVFFAGCASGKKPKTIDGSGKTVQRAVFTANNNPTTLAGRGEPSLDDIHRPAVWVFVDGQQGEFIERDGNPQVQWVIEGSVNASPTFRIEAFGPLLGTPKDLACTLDTVESADGSSIAYAIKADVGTFQLGRDYSLLKPGDYFTIRNRLTGDVVMEIAPLAPGTYLLAAGVKNTEAKTEGLAITHFTVGEYASE